MSQNTYNVNGATVLHPELCLIVEKAFKYIQVQPFSCSIICLKRRSCCMVDSSLAKDHVRFRGLSPAEAKTLILKDGLKLVI